MWKQPGSLGWLTASLSYTSVRAIGKVLVLFGIDATFCPESSMHAWLATYLKTFENMQSGISRPDQQAACETKDTDIGVSE